MIKSFVKQLLYYLWVIYGYLGPKTHFHMQRPLTVLITYYNPARVKHANSQVRNLLKCDFIKQIIVSNHNPELRIANFVRVVSERVVLLDQEIRRGCGYRWLIADQYSPAYLIVLDDDILLFPWQIRRLFKSLLAEPDVPHGFAGMVQQTDGSLAYFQKVNREVDYLCEVYAITDQMLRRYMQAKNEIQTSPALAKSIECTADFLIVSQTGHGRPKIHQAGHLLRCPTFNQAGVAVHREQTFLSDVHAIQSALSHVKLQA